MLKYLKDEFAYANTENGAVTNKSTKSKVLDYFSQASALRNRDENGIFELFEKSFKENPLITMKILFYSRDIRGGQGERKVFKSILKHLANEHIDVLVKNLHLVPEFGRWDDLYSVFNTNLEAKAIEIIKKQLDIDIKSDEPSLLGKWLKSENTSSKESRILATKTRVGLSMTSKEYRKMLSSLRAKIKIVETNISEKNYDDIDYSKVPSQASLKYRKAFNKNDKERYEEYIQSLVLGENKANTATLYPYQLVEKLRSSYIKEEIDLLNVMWRDLPDYIKDNKENNIAVVDTSGSMNGNPINVAVSLGLYLAERNNGAFKNHFITFSSTPQLVEIEGKTFSEKVENMIRAKWGMSTNIEATFDLILNTALKNNLPQEELPSRLFIISDMEFDNIAGKKNVAWSESLFETLTKRFSDNGYKMPKLVFWNVNSRNDNFPMRMDQNVQLVSGANPILFKSLLEGEFLDAYNMMLKEIEKERYNCVII